MEAVWGTPDEAARPYKWDEHDQREFSSFFDTDS